jgi:hypothetical protein
MGPAATFLNYVCTIKITQLFSRCGYHLLLFVLVRPATRRTITGVAQCHMNVGDPWSSSSFLRNCFGVTVFEVDDFDQIKKTLRFYILKTNRLMRLKIHGN